MTSKTAIDLVILEKTLRFSPLGSDEIRALIAELRAAREVVETAHQVAMNAGWNREHYMVATERFTELWNALAEYEGLR